MLKYMLDTNMVIYTIKNKPEKVRRAFKQHYGQLCISSISYMELVYGAERSANVEGNMRAIEGLVARLEVLSFDESSAAHAGQVRAELATVGNPIGPYDNQIAGHARSLGLIVVTNNEKEFARVPGLRVENWV